MAEGTQHQFLRHPFADWRYQQRHRIFARSRIELAQAAHLFPLFHGR